MLPRCRAAVDGEVERLTALCARVLGGMDDAGNGYCPVQLADPEGNEFCVV